MSDMQTQPQNTKTNRRISPLKGFFQAILLLCLIAIGWFLRGMMPGGGPGGPPPGAGPGAGGPPEVVVETVREGPNEIPKEYIGNVDAIQAVDISAQVVGYIEEVHFEEGSLVEQGDLLFTIEQNQYKARVTLSEAAVEQSKANLSGARADLEAAKADLEAAQADLVRAEKYLQRLQNADKRSVAQANMDTAISDQKRAKSKVQQTKARVDQGQATVQQMEALLHKAQAELDLAHIDLGYTEIRSPITGRIGEAVFTKGNYVGPSTGPLARIVQVDPIRVVFSMSDREYLSVIEEMQTASGPAVHTRLRLPNGSPFEGIGRWDFEDNEMNPQTGTIAVYARFSNEDRLLVPGSYVTVIMERIESDRVPIIPEEAVMTDQQGHFVYVVDPDNQVERRPVTLGESYRGEQRVTSGLSSGERIVVEGIQKVQHGDKVNIRVSDEETGGQS